MLCIFDVWCLDIIYPSILSVIFCIFFAIVSHFLFLLYFIVVLSHSWFHISNRFHDDVFPIWIQFTFFYYCSLCFNICPFIFCNILISRYLLYRDLQFRLSFFLIHNIICALYEYINHKLDSCEFVSIKTYLNFIEHHRFLQFFFYYELLNTQCIVLNK